MLPGALRISGWSSHGCVDQFDYTRSSEGLPLSLHQFPDSTGAPSTMNSRNPASEAPRSRRLVSRPSISVIRRNSRHPGIFIKIFAAKILLVSTALAQQLPVSVASVGGETEKMPTLTVTASGIPENAAESPQKITLFSQEKLLLEQPRSVVDFFSENAIGFAAPFAPGHALLTLRGAATHQIGYDDSSEIAVMINGRRAGTANLSKLSTIDAYSIEVLRGPSSIIYGSSAIGGVINLITKNGLNSPGVKISAAAGSWDRFTAGLETGGVNGKFDYYFGAQYQTTGDYKTGRNSPGDGVLHNTSYTRRAANLTLGYSLNATTRAELVIRTDGLYDVGHRGITYSLTDHDDRYNQSAELTLKGAFASGRATWSSHGFYVKDVEIWYWSQDPLLAPFSSPALGDRPGIQRDDNTRKNHVWGQNFASTISLSNRNTLLAGLDLSETHLRSDRIREAAPGYVEGFRPAPIPQPNVRTSPVNIAPLQYNYNSTVVAPYLEDTQKLLDGRLTLKGGARYDARWQGLRSTIYETPGLNKSTRRFEAVTYRVGANYRSTDWLTLKASVGTGFRAPNPVELYGNNFVANGTRIVGDPNLKNEESLGWEMGAVVQRGAFNGEATYFSNDIKNRIATFNSATATMASGFTTTVSANLAHVVTEGAEFSFSFDFAPQLGLRGYKIEPYVGGTYHFKFKIDDPVYRPLNNNQHILRVNKYQGTVGLRIGRKAKWDGVIFGVLSGPTYEAGASHGLINANYPTNSITGQPILGWIFKKESYWLVNARFSFQLGQQLRLFGGVNNLLNLNYDPSFLALNQVNAKYTVNPYKSQSRQSTGSSSPGRELFGGLQYSF